LKKTYLYESNHQIIQELANILILIMFQILFLLRQLIHSVGGQRNISR